MLLEKCGPGLKGGRVCEDEHLTGYAALAPQLLSSAAGEFTDGLDESRLFGNWVPKTTGAGDLLLRGRRILQCDAGLTLQFAHSALQHNPPAAANHRRAQSGQVKDCIYPGIP
jgi:hypothetical protein